MKFRVVMKDPDAMYEAVREAADAFAEGVPGLTLQERRLVAKQRGDDTRALCARWFDAGEYLAVEVDTEAGTCVVVDGAKER